MFPSFFLLGWRRSNDTSLARSPWNTQILVFKYDSLIKNPGFFEPGWGRENARWPWNFFLCHKISNSLSTRCRGQLEDVPSGQIQYELHKKVNNNIYDNSYNNIYNHGLMLKYIHTYIHTYIIHKWKGEALPSRIPDNKYTGKRVI